METYLSMRKRHQRTVNAFLDQYAFFAFSEQQFYEGLEKIGTVDHEKIVPIGGGGYILKDQARKYATMCTTIDAEIKEAINADQTGEGFCYQAFLYELRNHEYIVTYDDTEAIEALGLTPEEVQNKPQLVRGLELAKAYIMEHDEM